MGSLISSGKFNNYHKAKKIIFACGATIYALYEKGTIGNQASYLLLSGGYPNRRLNIAEELFERGMEIIEIKNDYYIFKNSDLFLFSHKRGELVLSSKYTYKIVEKNGKMA